MIATQRLFEIGQNLGLNNIAGGLLASGIAPPLRALAEFAWSRFVHRKVAFP